jgi:endo-1,4-beta-mannosidase
VLRGWFFQDMATTNGQRDWSRFDNTLTIAAKHGYRVIVTLANQWTDCDSGYGYKSASWYQTGYETVDPAGTESYRDYVRDIVTRYKDNPTILMWQLMNEAEAKTSRTGSCAANAESILQSWAADVSGLIKSIDSNHLVSIGTIGSGQCGASGTDYQTLHAIPTVDVCEYHDYGWPSTPMPGDKWNGLQTRINMCVADGRPIFVGETGINSTEDGGNLQTRANWFSGKFSAQFGAGVVGEVVWGWETSDGYGFWPGDPTLAVLAGY